MAGTSSCGLFQMIMFLIVALLASEARPSQGLHSHGHAHRHARALGQPCSSSIPTTGTELSPSNDAIRKLADVAPHFDGLDRAFEPADQASVVAHNNNKIPEEVTVESSAGFLDLLVPHQDRERCGPAPHQVCEASEHAVKRRALADPSSTSADPAAPTSSICPSMNGTKYVSKDTKEYEIICDLNIVKSDLPFQLVGSFEDCVEKCDSWNVNVGKTDCLAIVFVPGRLNGGANDCYLKKTIDQTEASTQLIEGAILSGPGTEPLTGLGTQPSLLPTRMNQASGSASTVSQTFASASNVITPKVSGSTLQGPTENHPSTQYIPQKPTIDLTLSKSLLTTGVNADLTTDYGLSLDTGCLQVNQSNEASLQDLVGIPHLSRDGGKGGYLKGQHLFIFCDTGSYANTTQDSNGEFLGFVSSSVAIDVGMNGLQGKPLYLQDGIGQWSDDAGRMRGFSPLTSGELGYNLADQGNGQRYAVWPEASLIPLDAESAVLYAPVVYDNVNRATGSTTFTYTGTTLLTLTVNDKSGPVAERTVGRLFEEDEVEWGCSAGIRSWGPSGVGGTDGKVYVVGAVTGGLLLARTEHDTVANRDSYEYWTGSSWSSGMIPPSSGSYFIAGAFLDLDVFYSPRHLTFILVYLTKYADSTFYYRYLDSDQAILPPYAKGGNATSDYAELLTQYPWSEEQVLYRAQPGLSGKFIYSGGVHQGYYGTDDITNGGHKMLISWTAPTGQDPASINSEYQIVTAEIDWV